jgi:small subunit ribosomal protein S6
LLNIYCNFFVYANILKYTAKNAKKKENKQLKNYELLTVFKPNLDVEEVDKILAKLEELISGYSGKILSADKIGRKKLAYDIQKYRDGFFVSQVLTMPADKVVDLKRQLKLNDNVLRIMFLEVSKALVAK